VADPLFGTVDVGLSYVPLLFVVLVATVWEERGTTLAIVCLATIVGWYTLQGGGPFNVLESSPGEALLEVQGYIGVAAVLGLLMGALNKDREKALQASAGWKVRFEAALYSSGHLMYEFDPVTRNIAWGGNVKRMLGLEATELASFDALLARVHPDDQSRLSHYSTVEETADETPGTRELHVRLRCGEGDYRPVVLTGAPIIDFDGQIYRVDGLLRIDDLALNPRG